jgi:hypothetical protein
VERRRGLWIGIGGLVLLAAWVIAVAVGRSDDPGPSAAASTTPTLPTTFGIAATTLPPTTTVAPAATATTELPPTTTAPVFGSSIESISTGDLPASWRSGCPVGVESLRMVEVSHWGFDGKERTGTLIVAAAVAEDMVDIMSRLFTAGFPIERMEPVDVYDGDDNRSMAANNTSAFNCRAVTGGSSWSEHSYGTAVDVNPLLNPYVRGGTVLPPEGSAYADRSLDEPGMIHAGDEVVEAFGAHGWIWGGTWDSTKDYQHFSTSGR